MSRQRLFFAGLCLLALWPTAGFSQESWPEFNVTPSTDPHDFLRGPGFYLAMFKLILVSLTMVVWVKLAAAVNKDSQLFGDRTQMAPEVWNPIVVFPFFVAFLFVVSFPLFLLSFPLYFAVAIGPAITYFVMRGGKISKEERARIKQERLGAANSEDGGFQMAPVIQEEGPPVEFKPAAKEQREQQACLISLRQNPAFLPLKSLFSDVVMRRVDQVLMDYTRDQVTVRFQVDGIWHEMPVMDRELGDAMLYGIKQLANLNPQDRKAKQVGQFGVSVPGRKIAVSVSTQGVKTGERALIKVLAERKKIMSLREAGMLASVEEKLRGHLNSPGLVVVSAMPGDGYTTTWNAVLESSDRMTRDFHSIGPKRPAQELDTFAENVDENFYDTSKGETPEEKLKTLLLKQPEALVLPEFATKEVFDRLAVESVKEKRFVITRVQARSAPEAIVRILANKIDRSQFAKALTAVVYSRMIRRLCDNCKQPYEPSPQLLAKLGIKAGQIENLYREWQPPPPEELVDEKGRPIEPEICPVCSGLGYLGRIAIFEVLEVDDTVRAAIVNKPSTEAITKAARSSGHKSLQEEGLKLVLAGVTSLAELQRILKASQS